ncbi:PleD family two-component system response regulator, partial [Novosphingobium huizhouense]|uniref:hypothetical protein n=1 Tax=Novosphingobium huizhouense TaxID=2866625 RepID=UPI001CD89758
MTARILIADGTATTRITLKVRLSEVCYDVCTASTFAELQARALTFQPDLVLIGSGFTQEHPVRIAMSLMADPNLAAVPIVMLANESLRLEALRAGVAAVLDPAIDEQMLLA